MLNMSHLVEHENFTLEEEFETIKKLRVEISTNDLGVILKMFKKGWNWQFLSANPNTTWEIVKSKPHKPVPFN